MKRIALTWSMCALVSGYSGVRLEALDRVRGARLAAASSSLPDSDPETTTPSGPQREWMKLYGYSCGEDDGEEPIRILSYNVLGPNHGASRKHDYCPMDLRKWENRKYRIQKEISGYVRDRMDAVCLQEVTPRTLETVWIPFMRRHGLDGFEYLPKILPADPKETDPDWQLGVATFYRSSELECLDSRRMLIRDCATKQSWSLAFQDNVRGKADGAVMIRFRCKAARGGQEFALINAHLWWDPREPHIKSAQAALLLEAAQEFAPSQNNIIIVGDFNSVPELQYRYLPKETVNAIPEGSNPTMSGVYRLLSTGRLPATHPEHPSGFARFSVGDFVTELQLRDVYGGAAGGEDEDFIYGRQEWVQFTTKTADFSGTIDYIFVTRDVWVSEVLALPYRGAGDFPPIPNSGYASDHLALGVAVFLST